VPGLTRATDEGRGVGAVDYMAPEQKRDAVNVDARADIFALGITLAEALTGHTPPRHGDQPILPETIPDAILPVLRRACAPDREHRYPTARAFFDALHQTITGGAVVVLSERLSLCPKTLCAGGVFSEQGYFLGPRIVEVPTDAHCQHCGTRFLQVCPGCAAPLPVDLGSVLIRDRKRQKRDKAHCRHCGTLIHATATCAKCGSFLKGEDRDADMAHGCSRCRGKQRATARPWVENDIPF
jgi:hypothetical protein